MRAHHVAILVRDVETCARFYAVVLGLEPMQAPRLGVAWFRLDDLILMIEPYTDRESSVSNHANGTDDAGDAAATGPGLHLLSLAIRPDERARWEARLSTHGVVITHRSDYSLYFCDPEQNRLALSHFPERVS
jgi:catechol 2,3-dioxygenase-like lactoylglutathione lyase family enzyme